MVVSTSCLNYYELHREMFVVLTCRLFDVMLLFHVPLSLICKTYSMQLFQPTKICAHFIRWRILT